MAVSIIKEEFKCEIEKVWELVTSLVNYSWRSDIDKIVVTVPEKEFEEYTKDGYVTKFKITAFDECMMSLFPIGLQVHILTRREQRLR